MLSNIDTVSLSAGLFIILVGIAFGIALTRPGLGPKFYGAMWPKHFVDSHQKHMAYVRGIALSAVYLLAGIGLALLGITSIPKVISWIFVGLSVVCILIILNMQSRIRRE